MFRFGSNEALFALLLVPLLAGFLWFALWQKRKALERFGEAELVRKLAATVSRRGLMAKRMLLLVALTLVIVALARPQFGTRVETVRREGQDIIVALDVSNSMLAEDIAPNRLERAKLAVARLIDRLEGDRVGLVAFAGDAFVQSPLTVDYTAARLFLNAMEPGLVRTHIEAFCRRQNLKYADILIWPLFEGQILTAGVMGLVRRFRYLLFTPALLQSLSVEEVDAVMAHEIGHVKRYHLQWNQQPTRSQLLSRRLLFWTVLSNHWRISAPF